MTFETAASEINVSRGNPHQDGKVGGQQISRIGDARSVRQKLVNMNRLRTVSAASSSSQASLFESKSNGAICVMMPLRGPNVRSSSSWLPGRMRV